MATDRFYVGYLDNNAGLETDVKPFAIADNAFAELTNAYVFRGRVRKRFGSKVMNQFAADAVQQLYTRLRIEVATTAAVTGNLAATIMPGAIWKIGQMFSVGTTMFTVYQANGATYTTGAATATYNTATGSLVITGNTENPSTKVYFYPSEPVMGLLSYDDPAVNDEPVFGFDTQFAYQYTSGAWSRLGTALWTGTDSQFFWGTNYRGIADPDYAIYVMNYNSADLIQWYNRITNVWTALNPIVSILGAPPVTTKLMSARCAISFRGRLLFFNTIEKTNAMGAVDEYYKNRIRYSQYGSPIDPNAFRQDTQGANGGFIDAPTREAIVSVGFIKDRLIVYFERSTWELVYNNNEVTPFVIQRISSELGVESTFSVVPFDRALIGMGNVGVHACNGMNVSRVDQKIPETIFEFANIDSGLERVYGVRDYFTQMVYWSFCYTHTFNKYPNRVLVYNYITGSWALNEDSITCFGYYQPNTSQTWETCSETWEESVDAWNSGQNAAKFRTILAGNQQGYVFEIDPNATVNASVSQITAMSYVAATNKITVTSYNHNLELGMFVKLENCVGVTGVNNNIYKIDKIISKDVFRLFEDPDTTTPFAGTYLGGGTFARVSNLSIKTKQYNFYVDQGRNACINKVDFHVDKTKAGQVMVDYFVGSAGSMSLVTLGLKNDSLLGLNILETQAYYPINDPQGRGTYEAIQDRLWHPLYFFAEGECIQLKIYMSDDQMVVRNIAESDFQLNAMIFYANPTSSRLQ